MLNIGWLGTDSEYTRGPVASELVEALISLAADQKNIMRGVHYCDFCGEESPLRLPAPNTRGFVSLGMGEIHVRGQSGVVFAAPSLVIHYITSHGYCPPQIFQQAVLAGFDAANPTDVARNP